MFRDHLGRSNFWLIFKRKSEKHFVRVCTGLKMSRDFVNGVNGLNGILEYRELKKTFSVDKKNQLDVTFGFFISLLIVAQHVSGNHVPIIRS